MPIIIAVSKKKKFKTKRKLITKSKSEWENRFESRKEKTEIYYLLCYYSKQYCTKKAINTFVTVTMTTLRLLRHDWERKPKIRWK